MKVIERTLDRKLSGRTTPRCKEVKNVGDVMLVIAGAVGGAIWGSFLARRRKGNRLDILQYSVAFAIAFALVGLFVTIALARIFG